MTQEALTLPEFRRIFGQRIQQLAEGQGIDHVRVFGSLAEGRLEPGSDIDLLVHLSPRATLLNLSALRDQLESLLGRGVDLVPDSADIHYPEIRERAVPL